MKRVIAVITILVLGACSFDRPSPEKSYYAFEAASAAPSPSSGQPTRLLRVPRASVAPPFGSRALQYRVAVNEYEPSYYHNWADDPGALVAAAARATLAAGSAFAILAPDADIVATATLDLYVTALYVDVTGPSPTVVLGLHAALRDDAGAVVLTQEFDRAEPAATAEAADAVAALNKALETILGRLSVQMVNRNG